jgi:hypothetical protein
MADLPLTIAAVARPGDTVLIGLADRMTDEDLGYLVEDFKEFTETTGIHIALVEGATSMVVARPEGDDEYDKEFPDDAPAVDAG